MATRKSTTKPAETEVEDPVEVVVEDEEQAPARAEKSGSKLSRAELKQAANRAALEAELAGYERDGRKDRAAAVRESLEAL